MSLPLPRHAADRRSIADARTAAIAESLRLYPTVPVVPRICNKATTIRGYYIPEGVRLPIPPGGLARAG